MTVRSPARPGRSLVATALALLLATGCADTVGDAGGPVDDATDGDGPAGVEEAREAAFAGYERTPAPEVGDLTLPAVEADGSDSEFTFEADDGELLLVYFGYTSCPDVCPTTLSDVRLVFDDLGDEADRIDLAMVTIDPEVDTPEVLTGYVRSFIPEATAIRTVDDSRLREVATVFGADYGAEEIDGEREVYHTGSLYAVSSAGELVLTWPFGVTTDDLELDLSKLLETSA